MTGGISICITRPLCPGVELFENCDLNRMLTETGTSWPPAAGIEGEVAGAGVGALMTVGGLTTEVRFLPLDLPTLRVVHRGGARGSLGRARTDMAGSETCPWLRPSG